MGRESCTNAKAKYSSSVVPLPPDPSVHFYHCIKITIGVTIGAYRPYSLLYVVYICENILIISMRSIAKTPKA